MSISTNSSNSNGNGFHVLLRQIDSLGKEKIELEQIIEMKVNEQSKLKEDLNIEKEQKNQILKQLNDLTQIVCEKDVSIQLHEKTERQLKNTVKELKQTQAQVRAVADQAKSEYVAKRQEVTEKLNFSMDGVRYLINQFTESLLGKRICDDNLSLLQKLSSSSVDQQQGPRHQQQTPAATNKKTAEMGPPASIHTGGGSGSSSPTVKAALRRTTAALEQELQRAVDKAESLELRVVQLTQEAETREKFLEDMDAYGEKMEMYTNEFVKFCLNQQCSQCGASFPDLSAEIERLQKVFSDVPQQQQQQQEQHQQPMITDEEVADDTNNAIANHDDDGDDDDHSNSNDEEVLNTAAAVDSVQNTTEHDDHTLHAPDQNPSHSEPSPTTKKKEIVKQQQQQQQQQNVAPNSPAMNTRSQVRARNSQDSDNDEEAEEQVSLD